MPQLLRFYGLVSRVVAAAAAAVAQTVVVFSCRFNSLFLSVPTTRQSESLSVAAGGGGKRIADHTAKVIVAIQRCQENMPDRRVGRKTVRYRTS